MVRENSDHVSKELRDIETQIDNCFKMNPLIQLPFGSAAWYYMAFCEDSAFMALSKLTNKTIHEEAAFADTFIFNLKNPFYWLFSSCEEGGEPPCSYDADNYQASIDLSELAKNYEHFETAFTYASRGYVELSLEDSTIVSTHDFLSDTRYEAYDRLVEVDKILSDFNWGEIVELVAPTVQVDDQLFSYSLNPKLVSRSMNILDQVLEPRYTLPDSWQFSKFSMGEFKQFSKSLMTLAFIHFTARKIAADKGCIGLGYSSSLFIADKQELVHRLARYSGCSHTLVLTLISIMTYGEMGIESPDPAIQPIIRLNNNIYSLMPNLLINSSIERNFTVLLNKLPSEKEVYSRLVSEKEDIMRRTIKNEIEIPNVRFFDGSLSSGLPDIDLAIISDIDKSCLFLELKWFIGPAEVREVIEKSEEIKKGITQMLTLQSALRINPDVFIDRLNIGSEYDCLFAVASHNFIGMINVQQPDIPVVRQKHLIKKGNLLCSLKGTIAWLRNRNYLPTEGKHYETVEIVWNIGKFGIKWYGIKPLLAEEFI